MKLIKYKFAANVGATNAKEMVLTDKTIKCADEHFDANYAIAQKEAYNGEITVEEVTTDAENT